MCCTWTWRCVLRTCGARIAVQRTMVAVQVSETDTRSTRALHVAARCNEPYGYQITSRDRVQYGNLPQCGPTPCRCCNTALHPRYCDHAVRAAKTYLQGQHMQSSSASSRQSSLPSQLVGHSSLICSFLPCLRRWSQACSRWSIVCCRAGSPTGKNVAQ